jgi:hypothetical protein
MCLMLVLLVLLLLLLLKLRTAGSAECLQDAHATRQDELKGDHEDCGLVVEVNGLQLRTARTSTVSAASQQFLSRHVPDACRDAESSDVVEDFSVKCKPAIRRLELLDLRCHPYMTCHQVCRWFGIAGAP